jgi:hypothetical protein
MQCKHDPSNVVADILEGASAVFAVMWCRHCGAYRHSKQLGAPTSDWRTPEGDSTPSTFCPKCSNLLRHSCHGAWCPDPYCKWGWECEEDGSPLKPPLQSRG